MAEAWNTNVPTTFQKPSYDRDRQDGMIRTSMSTGDAKTRRRFTAVTKTHFGEIIMTLSQFNTFESWFENTISFGALTFMFPDPLSGVSTEMRFAKPYTFKQHADTQDISVKVAFEVKP